MSSFLNQIFSKSAAKMGELPDGSVDLVFTSPPYERVKRYSDSPEDLGNYQGAEFVERLLLILLECHRVLKPTGSLFLNFQAPKLDGFVSPSEYLIPRTAVEQAGFCLAQTHYWIKPNASPLPAKELLKNSVELVWHFVKGPDFTVDKDALRVPSEWAEKDKRTYKYNPLGKDPGNYFINPKSQDQKEIHPAKMPDAVAERFVLYGSKPGETVLDPFCGSGTTLLAAQKHGRGFVGYDLNADYAAIARTLLNANFRSAKTVVPAIPNVIAAPTPFAVKPWMNIQEVSDYIGMAVSTIYGKICRGEIPVVKMGRLVRFNKTTIDEWLQSQAKATTAILKPGGTGAELNGAN